MSTSWVTRWRYVMAEKPSVPGIWKLKDGGYFVRAKYGSKVLPDANLEEAQAERKRLSKPKDESESLPLFAEFAVSLLEERVNRGKIDSASTEERWKSALDLYLIPAFGAYTIKELTHHVIVSWVNSTVAKWVKVGKPHPENPNKRINIEPSTANGWLRTLRTICRTMALRFDLPRDPFVGVEFFKERQVYSPEKPNSLSGEQVMRWLELAAQHYPQHYAMMVLGFVTGRRPGELRALRRNEDVRWAQCQILVRRSHSRGQVVRDELKAGGGLTLNVPKELIEILREHVAALPPGPMRDSELLFPATTGKLRTRTVLDKPFRKLEAMMELGYRLTPRAMRRSFQDLSRDAQVEALVARSISGHATEEMREHYSTVRAHEQRQGLSTIMKMVKK